MANISALLEIIRTAHLGRDMRQALHDSIDAVNDDVETCGQTLNVSSNKLQLKRGSNVLSEVTMPSGNVNSVNGQTGDVELDADDISDSSTTNKFVTDTEKSTWNGKSTVSFNPIKTTGETIAEITIDGVTQTLKASAGGGGGGAVDSVNGKTGDVVLDVDDINDVDINNLADGQTLVYDATSGKWVNGSGGGGTTDYSDLTNKPQINGVTLSGNKTASELGVKVNDNLLANGWFTVNTNGFSSTSLDNVDTVNKWKTYSLNGGSVAVNVNGGLTLTSESTSNSYLYQMIDNYAKMLDGKTITISLNVDGTIYSDTKTISDITSSYYKWWTMSNGVQVGYLLQEQDKYAYILWKSDSSTSKSVNIKSIKLEYGSISTLAYDTEPNYELELVKCGNGATKQDITSIVATGTTNNTGNTITNGQLFYLNGTLCKALSNIASGSTFTLNTNYAVKNLNDELADRPLKYKYVQPRYNSATTAGNTYVINNALSVMGLQSTDKVCGLVLASISGNSGEDGGQAFYISFNDTIEFTPKSGNTSYTILNMVVFYN